MALTRKLLKGMGLTDEQVDTIIEAHTDTVDGLKADVSKYKTDAEKLSDVQKELDDLKAKGDDGWKEKHDKLKGDFDTYKKDVEAKETHSKKVEAYKTILKDAGLSEKGIEKAIKYAFEHATEKDCIVIAGKGHEDYQIFKDKTIHFSDREVACKLLGVKCD